MAHAKPGKKVDKTLADDARKTVDDRGATAPWPLVLYDRCSRYGALPEAGGILDQDETLMMLMDICVSYARLGMTPMHDMTADQKRMLVKMKQEMRKQDG